ncbi:hypothetical protein TNCV_1467091 [Trichonephila clavipes]|uniref:Uncharacterized protein n=1 Tax=Trichonephila clavipes TaxID=2585209 RepID=A0A8X6V237_TRICX|nr:hypothetical protein TNCV_1467091 [Trichonephila clavipes]
MLVAITYQTGIGISEREKQQMAQRLEKAGGRIFDVKDAPRTGRSIVKNFDKIVEIIVAEWHVSDRSIARELKVDHKTLLNHLRKVGFKKKLDACVGAMPINTKKHDGSNFHLQSLGQTE